MAVDAFIWFKPPSSSSALQPVGESQDDFFKKYKAFEIKEFSFDLEHPHTMGSATSGGASGKVKFNEFTIKKPTDLASTIFFNNCASGVHYAQVYIACRKAGGDVGSAGAPFVQFCFSTVFTTKIDWTGPGDEGPEESITFVYGQFGIMYSAQDSGGNMTAVAPQGWDQVQNVSWTVPTPS